MAENRNGIGSNSFTNVAGQTFRVRPVNETLVTQALARIERDYRARGEPLDIPTYTVQLQLPNGESGGEQTFAHDEKSIATATPAEQAAWAAYQRATMALEIEKNDKRTRLWLLGGVACEAECTAEDWAKEQQAIYGNEIPSDPIERRWHYLSTVAVPTAEDLARAIGAVTLISLSGLMASEEVDALVDSFRHNLQRKTSEGMPHGAEPLEPLPEVAGDRDSQELGSGAQPAPNSKRRRHA